MGGRRTKESLRWGERDKEIKREIGRRPLSFSSFSQSMPRKGESKGNNNNKKKKKKKTKKKKKQREQGRGRGRDGGEEREGKRGRGREEREGRGRGLRYWPEATEPLELLAEGVDVLHHYHSTLVAALLHSRVSVKRRKSFSSPSPLLSLSSPPPLPLCLLLRCFVSSSLFFCYFHRIRVNKLLGAAHEGSLPQCNLHF